MAYNPLATPLYLQAQSLPDSPTPAGRDNIAFPSSGIPTYSPLATPLYLQAQSLPDSPMPYGRDNIAFPNSGLPNNYRVAAPPPPAASGAPAPGADVPMMPGVEVSESRLPELDRFLEYARSIYPEPAAPTMEQGRGFQFNIPGVNIPGLRKGFKPGMSGGTLDAVAQSILGSLQGMREPSGFGESFAKGLASGFASVRGKEIEDRRKKYEEGIEARKEALKNQRAFAGELFKSSLLEKAKPVPAGKKMLPLTNELRAWFKARGVEYAPEITEVDADEARVKLEKGPGGPSAAEKFTITMGLSDRLTSSPEYKDYRIAQTALDAMTRATQSKGESAAKFAIAAINKLVDPDSVIRESEVAYWTALTSGLRGKLLQGRKFLFSQPSLTEGETQELIGLAKQIIAARRVPYEQRRAEIAALGRTFGVSGPIPEIPLSAAERETGTTNDRAAALAGKYGNGGGNP